MKRVVAFLLALVLAFPTYALATGTTQYEVSLASTINGSDVMIGVFVSNPDKPNTNDTTYNAFQFVFMYDPVKLKFASEKVTETRDKRELKCTDRNGTLIVSGCGEDLRCDGSAAVILHFNTESTGTTQVRLVEALVSERSNVKLDAAVAAIPNTDTCKNGVLTITTGSFGVTLPSDLELIGDSSVASGGAYTFRVSPYYDYTLTATAGGEKVDIKENSDGTFYIENVNGVLKIEGTKAPKSYNVTVTGSGASDVTTSEKATYDTDYTFSIKKANLSDYAVTATVGGRVVSLTDNGDGSYTIFGTQITGDITITVSKAAQANTTLVIISGNGAGDVLNESETVAQSGANFTILLKSGIDNTEYTVSVGNTVIPWNSGTAGYIIDGNLVTGAFLSIVVTKTAKMNVEVTVNQYSYLKNDGYAYLITAKNNGAAQAGQGFAYNGAPMYYSPKYEAFALVIAANNAPTVGSVKSKLTVSTAPYTSVTYNGDVNDTGKLDVNDAQLVYDMYLGKHTLSADGITQMMWLRADATGNRVLDVQDVQTVLQAIV